MARPRDPSSINQIRCLRCRSASDPTPKHSPNLIVASRLLADQQTERGVPQRQFLTPKVASVGRFVEPLSTRMIGSFADKPSQSGDRSIAWGAAGPSKAAAQKTKRTLWLRKQKRGRRRQRSRRLRRSRPLARAAIPPEQFSSAHLLGNKFHDQADVEV